LIAHKGGDLSQIKRQNKSVGLFQFIAIATALFISCETASHTVMVIPGFLVFNFPLGAPMATPSCYTLVVPLEVVVNIMGEVYARVRV
jgi:hypothetical protein